MAAIIYSDEHRHLIRKLKKARSEASLTQKEAAKLFGKTQTYISRIESGQRRVDVAQLRKFAKIYNKELGYFIEE